MDIYKRRKSGSVFRYCRARLLLSQRKMADLLNKSQSHYSRIEREERVASVNDRLVLCQLMGMSYEEIEQEIQDYMQKSLLKVNRIIINRSENKNEEKR